MFSRNRSILRLTLCRRIVAVATVAAITVTAAALARLALLVVPLALFLAVLGRSRHHRVAGFIRSCDHAGMCGVEAVGLRRSGCRCSIAVAALVTALIASAITPFTAFTAWLTTLLATLTAFAATWP